MSETRLSVMPLTEKEILNSTKMPVLASSWLSVRLLVQKVRLFFQLRFAVVVCQKKNLTKYTIMVLMISAELQASTLETSKNLVSLTSLYSMHQSMEMFTEFQMVLFSLRVLFKLIHQELRKVEVLRVKELRVKESKTYQLK